MSETKGPKPRLVRVGDWHRRMRGPFRGFLQDVDTDMCTWTQETPSLEAAVAWFVEALPYDGFRAAVLDESGWIVLGVSYDEAATAKVGHPIWMGSDIGFAVVEMLNLVDPVESAMWESYARGASDRERWWT